MFLEYPEKKILPDSNAAERCIRNAKVKGKVSGQFKSGQGAKNYVAIRSIVDTSNKQGVNIHDELVKIASDQFH